MGTDDVAAMLVVTPETLPALLLLFRSCSVKSSLSTSGSVVSPNKSQSGSAGSRFGRPDLLPAAEVLEERLGSESDRSESQSLSPATEPQPSTDTSTGPEPELSESDSLKNRREGQMYSRDQSNYHTHSLVPSSFVLFKSRLTQTDAND